MYLQCLFRLMHRTGGRPSSGSCVFAFAAAAAASFALADFFGFFFFFFFWLDRTVTSSPSASRHGEVSPDCVVGVVRPPLIVKSSVSGDEDAPFNITAVGTMLEI